TDIFSGTNTFTGGVTIGNAAGAAGGVILQLGSAGAINTSGANAITFAAGSTSANYGMRLNGFNATVAGLTTVTSGSEFVENGSFNDCTLTVNNTNPSSFGGIIQDKGSTGTTAATGKLSLVKNGTGLFTLTASNSYSGTTTINGGTLQLSGSGSITNSTVTINSGTLAGNGTAGNTTLTSASASLSPGTPSTIATLTVNSLTVNSGELKVNLGPSNSADKVQVNTNANFAGTTKITPTFSGPPTAGSNYNLVNAVGTLTSGGSFTINLPPSVRFAAPTVDTSDGHN